MHKSYYTVKPCQSKILQMKWDQRYYNAHVKKLKEIYPVIDTRAPKTYMHMHLKLKKIRNEEERLFLIERDNRILLEKMSQIMRTGGRVDNHNNYVTKSLNREKKQRELLRVARENQEIMERIIDQKPQYSVKDWDDDWSQNLAYIDQISAYPSNWWLNNKQEPGQESSKPQRSSSQPPSQSKRSGSPKSDGNDDLSTKSKSKKHDKKKETSPKESERKEVKESEKEPRKQDEEEKEAE